jgi:bifunctional pyridoxal-dependent enzyme with beta-cystathionase and maltose regulon repressor activities
MRLCPKYSIHLIVDEIYALSVFVNPEHIEMEGFHIRLGHRNFRTH